MAAAVRNTAIKRIQGDIREMMTNPSDQYAAAPLEDNMFDWHFTLRGPRDTEFEGGIYHGRILLPADYPFKPPNIMLLTPNGRFEVRKKICLSISAHHPEEWQPAWGVRLILEALISFMPTKGEGAIGALDFTPEERRRLARLSVNHECDTCGKVADLLPPLKEKSEDKGEAQMPNKYAAQIAQLHMHSLEKSEENKQSSTSASGTATPSSKLPPRTDSSSEEKSSEKENVKKDVEEEKQAALFRSTSSSSPAPTPATPAEIPAASSTSAASNSSQGGAGSTSTNAIAIREPTAFDSILHYLTVALIVALLAMIYKKLLHLQGVLQ